MACNSTGPAPCRCRCVWCVCVTACVCVRARVCLRVRAACVSSCVCVCQCACVRACVRVCNAGLRPQFSLSPLRSGVSGLARFLGLSALARETVACLSACERGESARPELAETAGAAPRRLRREIDHLDLTQI